MSVLSTYRNQISGGLINVCKALLSKQIINTSARNIEEDALIANSSTCIYNLELNTKYLFFRQVLKTFMRASSQVLGSSFRAPYCSLDVLQECLGLLPVGHLGHSATTSKDIIFIPSPIVFDLIFSTKSLQFFIACSLSMV